MIAFHESKQAKVTATAVRPPARFGYLEMRNGLVTKFCEKDQINEGWINGGFFIVNRYTTEHIRSDDEPFETGALPRLTSAGKLYSYQHKGFWFPIDTRSEQQALNLYAQKASIPWKNF